jgi:LmbE family N-acetylglucosaminyl deacetylase
MHAVRQLPVIAPDVFIGEAPLLVISPHPDDEALGAGGLIASARRAGRRVVVVMLTDGGGSHPNSRRYPRDRLIALRKAEAARSARELGLSRGDLVHLDLPDGNAPSEGPLFERTVDALAALASDVGAASVFVSWEHDPHRDHQAAALMACALRVRDPRLKLWFYPVWGWHLDGDTPIDEAPPSGCRIDVAPWLAAKRAAIAAHLSQTTDLIDDDPEGFRFDDRTLAPFLGRYEYFIEAPAERGFR